MEANSVFLRYKLSGHGSDTVVLLHQASMTLDAWDEIVPMIEGRHKVLRYDLRGFGLSERINGTYTMDDAVKDLHDLLDVLDIKGPVVLVGAAVGGAIALKFAAMYPERVKSVIGIAPTAYQQPRLDELHAAEQPASQSGDTTAGRHAADKFAIGDSFYPLGARRARPDRFARFQAIMASAPYSSVVATMRMSYAQGFSTILPNISCSVVIIGSSLFSPSDNESLRTLAEAIPRGRFAALPVGRYAAISEPDIVGPAIRSFIDN